MKPSDLSTAVNEVWTTMLREATEQAPDLEKKLEALRQKLVKEMKNRDSDAHEPMPGRTTKGETRLPVHLVAELVETDTGTLMLYLVNTVRNRNERALVEVRAGNVIFYAECD